MTPDQHIANQFRLIDLFSLTGICTFAAALFLFEVLNGTGSFLMFPDAREQTYAWWQQFARAWEAGYVPLWDPHIYSGRSFVGEMQTAVFYPLNWIWLALFSDQGEMPILAVEGLIILHFALAAGGMFLLLRKFELGAVPALLGALAFALFGPVAERAAAQANIFAGLAWLPWAMLATTLHLERRSTVWSLLAGAVIGLQLLAGHAQPAFHAALLCGLMCAWSHRKSETSLRSAAARTVVSGLPMVLGLLLVAGAQLWLTLEYLSDAYRWVTPEHRIGPGSRVPYDVMSTKHVWHFRDLFALIDPWRFRADDANTPHVGALGWMLAALGGLTLWKGRSIPSRLKTYLPLLLVVAGIAALAALAWIPPLTRVIRAIPVLGEIRELGRHAVLVHVALCFTLALGAAGWIRSKSRSAWQPSSLVWPLIALASLVLHRFDLLSREALWVTTAAALALFVSGQIPQRFAWARAACLLGAMGYSAWLYVPLALPRTQGLETLAEDFAPLPILATVEAEYGQTRIHIEPSAGLPKNYSNLHALQSRMGHSATMYRPYYDLLDHDWSLGGWVNDVLNVRYVLTKEELDFDLVEFDEVSGLRLYLRKSALPRVFKLNAAGDPLPLTPPEAFHLTGYADNEVAFVVTLTESATVVISEIDVAGWCAQVDGKAVESFRPTIREKVVALRALALGPGSHQVRYTYRPFGHSLGACDDE